MQKRVVVLSKLRRYILNLLISLDQLGNSLLAGDPDETISSRIGRIKQKWGGKIPRWRCFTRWADWVLERIDPNHTVEAIEHDEGGEGIADKPTPPHEHVTYFEKKEEENVE